MGGAAIMAAESAAYSGAGKVSLATQPNHVLAALVRQPEIMAVGVASGGELSNLLNGPSVIAAGMGLGRKSWAEQLLQQVLKTSLPLVLDADALSLLANQLHAYHKRGNWVLTPHPGEAAVLLNTSTAVVQQNRFDAVEEIQRTYGGIVVLKGAGTLINDGQRTYVANVGNAGLATAGSGDILAGLIAGLISQGLDLSEAAQLGVCTHGEAGDLLAAEQGQRGLCASDLSRCIRELLN